MAPDEDIRAQRETSHSEEEYDTTAPSEALPYPTSPTNSPEVQEAEGTDRSSGHHRTSGSFNSLLRREAAIIYRHFVAVYWFNYLSRSFRQCFPFWRFRGAQYSPDGSRFWAVLIGIDAYQGNPLRGCVSDALLIKEFLTDVLGVPEGRIQCLLGYTNPNPGEHKTPSRANIVDMLYNLGHNPEIDRDDNIIVYYAGHGSAYRCPEHPYVARCHNRLCPIEALCPLDRDTQNSDGKWIPDISDREINNLFKHISLAKGNRITFIADCCFARSFSRQDQDSVRSVHPTSHASLYDMLHAADKGWTDSDRHPYQSVFSKDWQADFTSHVILAACQDQQSAMEVRILDEFGGIFTRLLVRVLKSAAYKGTTYVDLVHLMNQSPSQTPVVAGARRYEPLWCVTPQ